MPAAKFHRYDYVIAHFQTLEIPFQPNALTCSSRAAKLFLRSAMMDSISFAAGGMSWIRPAPGQPEYPSSHLESLIFCGHFFSGSEHL
jgi:hypothetical protein